MRSLVGSIFVTVGLIGLFATFRTDTPALLHAMTFGTITGIGVALLTFNHRHHE